MITDEELMLKLRSVTGWAESLAPTEAEWDRIRTRRMRGERLTIPPMPRRAATIARWLPAALVALLMIALYPLGWYDSWPRSVRPASTVGGSAPFVPEMLVAQTTSRPSYPALGDSIGYGLRAGRWLYSDEPPGQQRPWDTLLVYTVAPGEYAGKPAWLILLGRQSASGGPISYSDSTWLSQDGLETLMHHVAPHVAPAPLAAKYFTVLQRVPLSLDWSTSVPVQAAAGGTTERRWMNLKVYGQEDVEVPAGKFRCWRVGASPDAGFYFWVSADGMPVRQGMRREDDYSFGKINLYLVRREEI